MKSIAIIPARSGSKGLPDKNIKLLNGKPLLAYTIQAAIDSNQFEEIMVSTDSEEYAKIAKEYGASVPFLRSVTTSGDTASSWDVVKEVLSNYQKNGQEFDTVALLQPTSPLRDEMDIMNCFETFEKKAANFVVSVCEMDHSPLWANTLPEDQSMEHFIDAAIAKMPRQQIPTYYRINGAVYLVDTEYLFSHEDLYSNKSYACLMSKEKSIDIDEQLDFTIAEVLLSN